VVGAMPLESSFKLTVESTLISASV